MRALEVLVIDDEKNIRTTVAVCLESIGCKVTAAQNAPEALSAVQRQSFDLAFLDLRLGTGSGLELLPQLLAQQPHLDVVMITAYAAVDTAVEAIRRGAIDYLPKPFTPTQIRRLVETLQQRKALQNRVFDLEGLLAETVPEARLETQSPAMRNALDLVLRVADSEAAVLLRGESGTGKGVLARAIHSQGPRAKGPFVVVACPTLSEDLLASELFGHAKGAFTGALRDQPGRVEAASGGTLFLDEISEISPSLQAKLLRFVQEKRFERIGESRTRVADVRILTATNRDLQAEVDRGAFRLDLYYRLNVVEILVPPLRERREDLLSIAQHFLDFFAKAAGRPVPQLSEPAQRVLLAHTWPGNLRELRNEMERAVVLSRAQILEPAVFSARVAAAAGGLPTLGGPHSLEDIEKEHILRVLAQSSTQEEAARILGIDVSTLWRKRKRYEGA